MEQLLTYLTYMSHTTACGIFGFGFSFLNNQFFASI